MEILFVTAFILLGGYVSLGQHELEVLSRTEKEKIQTIEKMYNETENKNWKIVQSIFNDDVVLDLHQ